MIKLYDTCTRNGPHLGRNWISIKQFWCKYLVIVQVRGLAKTEEQARYGIQLAWKPFRANPSA